MFICKFISLCEMSLYSVAEWYVPYRISKLKFNEKLNFYVSLNSIKRGIYTPFYLLKI